MGLILLIYTTPARLLNALALRGCFREAASKKGSGRSRKDRKIEGSQNKRVPNAVAFALAEEGFRSASQVNVFSAVSSMGGVVPVKLFRLVPWSIGFWCIEPCPTQRGDFRLAESHRFYGCHDLLLKYKGALLTQLTERWKDLFNAKFEVLLYDLTKR
jgi:hypothetical protein